MAQGQPGQDSGSANLFWMTALLFGGVIVFWFLDSQAVVIPVFWVRIYEIEVMRILAEMWMPIAQFLHLPLPDLRKLAALQHYMQHAAPNKVGWNNFSAINAGMGQWTRYPVTLVFALLALFSYFGGAAQHNHNYNMKTLRATGKEIWPQITPVLSLDLVKENIDKGPWAMARLPLDFCRMHDLLLVRVISGKKIWGLKQKPAYRLFALQLGPAWIGLDALPIHAKALAVIFLARATGQRPIAKTLLSQISASAAGGKLDFTGVSDHLKKFKDHKIVRWLERRHAYMNTFLASLLEVARSDGVLASAEFLWLKPVDRRLWYVLNCVGRRTAFVEIAGVYSHWKAEQKIGRSLKTPMVKGAVDALEETLQNVLLIEEGDQWRTISAD
ncbi:MAG: type IVB secretion system coupling complex protein DotM/IcmP [Gammaproteobacteria bacterium]|nr:type IVB secretion system coupling complex protein DotM/IcmP [Gammaproteobacteria bacterium]